MTDLRTPVKEATDGSVGEAGTPSIAVAGCGDWGKNLVRVFAEMGALAAVCDSDSAKAGEQAETHGVPALEWPAILSEPGLPAVAIAAPAARHHALARAALRAGKHVFVEKPLALYVSEAEELCQLAETADRRLMVGHLLQYRPAFVALKQLTHEGRLGRLQYIYSTRLNLGKFRREENILWSFVPHDISMILALVREDPSHVSATGTSYLRHPVADVTTTHLSFPGGENARVFVSWLHPFKEQKLVVVGEQAMAVFDDGEPWQAKLFLYPHKIDWRQGQPLPSRTDAVPVELAPQEPLNLECAHFLDCVTSGQTPRTDGREGLSVLRVRQAAERSMGENRSASNAGTGPGAQGRHPGVMIHESAYVDEPVEIGEGTKIWHFSHVLPGARIARDCVIGQNVMIGNDVAIGDRCKIQNNVSVYKGVTLEDGVFCGPSCVFTNVDNPRAEIERKAEFRPTLVCKGVTIGANATVVCGHELGEYAFIGAGAVVNSDVPAHALMVGVPARRIGWMSHAGERLGDNLVCPRSGRRYRQAGPDRLEELGDG